MMTGVYIWIMLLFASSAGWCGASDRISSELVQGICLSEFVCIALTKNNILLQLCRVCSGCPRYVRGQHTTCTFYWWSPTNARLQENRCVSSDS